MIRRADSDLTSHYDRYLFSGENSSNRNSTDRLQMEHPSLNHCCILIDAGTSLFCWRIYAPIIKTLFPVSSSSSSSSSTIILLYLETHRISKTCQINVKIKYHILICNLYLIFCTTNISMKCLWGKCMYLWICGIWDFPFLLNQPNQNIITSDIIWKHLVLTRMEQCMRSRADVDKNKWHLRDLRGIN